MTTPTRRVSEGEQAGDNDAHLFGVVPSLTRRVGRRPSLTVGLVLSLAALLPLSCSKTPPPAAPVRFFAAASTREALEEITKRFRTQTGIPVELNFAASSTLARQIEQGASADLFLSADEAWADYIAARDLVERRRDLLTNRLVVVAPARSNLKLQEIKDLAGPAIQRLALAGSAVPAGRYARETLEHDGIWPQMKDRVIEGADVRGTLAFVDRGEADAGMVYASDITSDPRVRLVLEVKPELHSPILYPLVLVKQAVIPPGAKQLYDYLGSDDCATSFRKMGFGIASTKGSNP